jgi:hypothetical protein
VISSLRQPYATATKAATKPRASTSGSTEKEPAKQKVKTARPKTKSKAKPKKKEAPKKRVKKPLTEKQKAKLQEQKKRLEIKSLKSTALLSPPKQLSTTAWTVLVSAELMKDANQEQGQALKLVSSRVKELSAKYKSMDASEREVEFYFTLS